jgi:alpha-D-ribose 1-methylphosphonate 5-triphosphate diphosphatase PhnM
MVTSNAIDFMGSQESASRDPLASDDDATLFDETAKVDTVIAEFPTTLARASDSSTGTRSRRAELVRVRARREVPVVKASGERGTRIA